MARLNEPAAPTENIESLKRRFMRQNRDIARANSTQSLRIRNLENETSRLLAENLGLREQILHLQNEIENGKSQRIADRTGAIKTQLEAKLLEISSLIHGLGEQSPTRKRSPRAGKITRASSATSPDQKNWRNACTLSESLAGQEGRLPPISENKSYPRRTLESYEIINLIADAEVDPTESPEIGPPPISQFVDEDPVKIDLPKKTQERESEEHNVMDPALSVNLEQRRKRRESVGSGDSKKPSKNQTQYGIREATGTLKSGAKRKLSARDDEETATTAKPRDSSPDDFNFTRVGGEDKAKVKQESAETIGNRTTRELAIARGVARDRPTSGAVPPIRKVLAPKSVNNSPKKPSRILPAKDTKPAKQEPSKVFPIRERPKEKPQVELQRLTLSDAVLESIEVHPEPGAEPETPAALDEFSPPSSQPSTARVESRDTPPPPDLGPGGEGQRPSRRARGAVSYAVPNLRDKMRRPTKDLIDAVAKDGKSRPSIVKLEEDSATTTTATIKHEPDSEDAWKHMPAASSVTVENSPLSSKAPITDTLPTSITTHRKRRESLLNQGEADSVRASSGTAIAALLAENRRAKAAAKEKAAPAVPPISKDTEKLDIYEFRCSSPTADDKVKEEPHDKPLARVPRKTSSASRDLPSDSEASDMEGPKMPEGSSSRRRQSTLGLRSSSTSTLQSSKMDEQEKLLKRPASTIGLTENGAAGSRSDRISARRRSMML